MWGAELILWKEQRRTFEGKRLTERDEVVNYSPSLWESGGPKGTTQLAASEVEKKGKLCQWKEILFVKPAPPIRRSHFNKGILAFSVLKEKSFSFRWQFSSVSSRRTLIPTPFTHKLCITGQLCTSPTQVLTFHSSELSSSNLLWEIRPPVEGDCAKMLFMTEQLAKAQSCQFLQVIAYACGWYTAFFTPIFLT